MNIILRKAENHEWMKLVVKNLHWCPDGQPDYGIDKIRRYQVVW